MKIEGNLVDIHNSKIFPAIIYFNKGRITSIEKTDIKHRTYILPGLIDAHIHIESSMVTPGAFAKAAVRHGTTGVISDPHEIANVLGIDGVKFMIGDAEKVPVKFWFGASPCVPATRFETNGATLSVNDIQALLQLKEIKYLAEMMNFPGVIYDDNDVMSKLKIAKNAGKPIDGHAPGLSGDMLKKYVSEGISTDHECSTIDEAKEKIKLGMKILIREGSAAKNLNSLKDLFSTSPDMLMLCSDDLHPEMLIKRHINKIIAQLISEGFNEFDVIRSATINPVNHYNLDCGLLRVGDNADFILVDSLTEMNVHETWISGKKVYAHKKVIFKYTPGEAINKFRCRTIDLKDIVVMGRNKSVRVINAFEGELLTKEYIWSPGRAKVLEASPEADILKIVVKDRYNDTAAAVGFIRGFGLKKGAFASSVAHDSHNIIAIGSNDNDIVSAINEVVRLQGGLAVSAGLKTSSLQLNIGGIMTTRSCEDVARDYERLNKLTKSLGCTMAAPFMTLSFMALLVIPDLKIGDQGLFDVKKFELVSMFVDEE
jgi:adenine deaminase